MTTIYDETLQKYKAAGYPNRAAKAMAGAAFFKKHGKTVREVEAEGSAKFELEGLDCDLVKSILGIAEYHPKENACGCELVAHGAMNDWKGKFVPNEEGVVVVVGTRAGAPINIVGPKPREVYWTAETLTKMTNTWIGGTAGRNHETFNEGKILDAFYEDGNAYFIVKPDSHLLGDLNECVGVSVEAQLKTDDNNQTIDGRGTGLTFIFDPKRPACSPEAGCKAMGETQRSDKMETETKDMKTELEQAQAAMVSAKTEFEAALAAKDETIKTLSGEVTDLKEFKEKAIAEKRTALTAKLAEFGVASEKVTAADITTLELMIEVAQASAKKAEDETVHDSGAAGTEIEKGVAADVRDAKKLVETVIGMGY